MKTYKLFRMREGHLYPLFVETGRETEMGKWLEAGIGELVDPTHVKSKLGRLRSDRVSILQRFLLSIGSERSRAARLSREKIPSGVNAKSMGNRSIPLNDMESELCRRIGTISGRSPISRSPGSSQTELK